MVRALLTLRTRTAGRRYLPVCFVAAMLGVGSLAPAQFPYAWLSSGGAIGEAAVIQLRNAPPSSPVALACSTGIYVGPPGLTLAPPIYPFATTTTDPSGSATVRLGVPNVATLIGLILYTQAGGAHASLWLTNVEAWGIAAPATPRFLDRRLAAPIQPGAAVLASGNLLVVGGSSSTLARTRDAYLLTPSTGQFARVGSMSVPRMLPPALANRVVYCQAFEKDLSDALAVWFK